MFHQQKDQRGHNHRKRNASEDSESIDTDRTTHVSPLAPSQLTRAPSLTFVSGTSSGEDLAAVATRRLC